MKHYLVFEQASVDSDVSWAGILPEREGEKEKQGAIKETRRYKRPAHKIIVIR